MNTVLQGKSESNLSIVTKVDHKNKDLQQMSQK